jgi:hypothetical protein
MPDSAQIDEPPRPAKLELIRRFLKATGVQQQIDTGSFLERYAFLGGPLLASGAEIDGATFKGAVESAFAALRNAYEPHRHVWQEEYESHVNWEFTEHELELIVAFLEASEGQHFLEGRWRMDAYIGTNTEDLVEEIVAQAQSSVRKQ